MPASSTLSGPESSVTRWSKSRGGASSVSAEGSEAAFKSACLRNFDGSSLRSPFVGKPASEEAASSDTRLRSGGVVTGSVASCGARITISAFSAAGAAGRAVLRLEAGSLGSPTSGPARAGAEVASRLSARCPQSQRVNGGLAIAAAHPSHPPPAAGEQDKTAADARLACAISYALCMRPIVTKPLGGGTHLGRRKQENTASEPGQLKSAPALAFTRPGFKCGGRQHEPSSHRARPHRSRIAQRTGRMA